MENYYIQNDDTGKLELYFDKTDYDALTDQQKQQIKSAFLWGRRSGCWISRCKWPNLWKAQRIAESLNLENAGRIGTRPTFAAQLEQKQQRAERRAERYETYAENAAARAEHLQKPITDMHGDIAFFTQPNINSSAGRAFTRKRDKMFAAFEKGFQEFNKSEYFKSRAATARTTAAAEQLQDPAYLRRRIDERVKTIKAQQRNIESYQKAMSTAAQSDKYAAYIEHAEEIIEAAADELGYFQDAYDACKTYTRADVKPGSRVYVRRWGSCKVLACGPKYFTADLGVGVLKFLYEEICEIIQP